MYFRITLTAPWPFLSLFSGISNMKGKNGPAFLDVSWSNSLTDSFKYLCGLATQYLVDLMAVAAQSRYNLRSSMHGLNFNRLHANNNNNNNNNNSNNNNNNNGLYQS